MRYILFLGMHMFDTQPLVDIEKVIPGIILDIRYATKDNFTGQIVYPKAKCFLRRLVAIKLSLVEKDLQQKKLRLKIFDGYRPFSCQKKFWDLVSDFRYVADPKVGSNHNRGSAVDVTLMTQEKEEVKMPTEFDNFSKKAHRDFMELPQEVKNNREILEKAMRKRGFVPLPSEWWHFDDENAQEYEILDVSFEELYV